MGVVACECRLDDRTNQNSSWRSHVDDSLEHSTAKEDGQSLATRDRNAC